MYTIRRLKAVTKSQSIDGHRKKEDSTRRVSVWLVYRDGSSENIAALTSTYFAGTLVSKSTGSHTPNYLAKIAYKQGKVAVIASHPHLETATQAPIITSPVHGSPSSRVALKV
jgi:hypothetical protein